MSRSKPEEFLRKNWKGIVFYLFPIFISIYLFVLAKENRDLCFFENPTKATVFKSGQAAGLQVLHQGTPIDTDVTIVQVAVWNHGRKSIRQENILKPVILYTSPGCSILDASIRKASRDVSDIRLDKSSLKEGTLPISWKILEKNDGAAIQLIVAGKPATAIRCKGTIEGQKNIAICDKNSDSGFLLLFNGMLFLILGVLWYMLVSDVSLKLLRYFLRAIAICFLIFGVLCVYVFILPRCPFVF